MPRRTRTLLPLSRPEPDTVHVRASEVLAGLGGDRFVILAAGLAGRLPALGRTPLDALATPSDLRSATCRVGLSGR